MKKTILGLCVGFVMWAGSHACSCDGGTWVFQYSWDEGEKRIILWICSQCSEKNIPQWPNNADHRVVAARGCWWWRFVVPSYRHWAWAFSYFAKYFYHEITKAIFPGWRANFLICRAYFLLVLHGHSSRNVDILSYINELKAERFSVVNWRFCG